MADLSTRARFDLEMRILRAIADLSASPDRKGALPTHVMTRARTAWVYVDAFTSDLVKRGFLEKVQRPWGTPSSRYVFHLTSSGLALLKRYEDLLRDVGLL